MAKFDSVLFDGGFAVGSTIYEDYYQGDDRQNRIVLTITPERKKDSPAKMIMDTGAPWCILDPELAETWDLTSDYAEITKLNIRGEVRLGRLLRTNIILRATRGENLKVEATFFVPFMDTDEAWNYPNFLGLNGFLDRIRFAVDATENAFYFGH